MTKRRNVMLGLGALAFGSGATFVSGAFDGQVTSPSAELQVLADARLSVRAPANPPTTHDASWVPAVQKDPLDNFSDPAFDRENLPTAQIHANDINNDFAIRSGVTTGEQNYFDAVIEILNEDATTYDVGISYGDYDDPGVNGYGADVDDLTWDSGDASVIDRKDVQEMYQFRIPDNANYLPASASASEKLISPDPSTDQNDKYNETVTIGDGEAAIVVMRFNTQGKAGHINNAATGGNPFQGTTYVSLLEKIWIEATETTA